MYETSAHRCLACEDVILPKPLLICRWLPRVFSLLFHKNQLDDHAFLFYCSSVTYDPLVLQTDCMCRDCRFWYQAFQSNYNRAHGPHLSPEKTKYCIFLFIMLIKRRKHTLFTLWELNLNPHYPKMLCANLVEIGPAVLEKKILNFCYFVIISFW